MEFFSSLLEKMKRARSDEDYEDLHIAHDAFHKTIYRACGLNTFCGFAEMLLERAKRFRRLYVRSKAEAKPLALEQHRRIYQACEARDAEAAEMALRENLLATVVRLIQTYFPDYKMQLLTKSYEELQDFDSPVAGPYSG